VSAIVTAYFTAFTASEHQKNCLIFQNLPKNFWFWDGLFDICMILFNNGNSDIILNKYLNLDYLIIQSRAKKSKG